MIQEQIVDLVWAILISVSLGSNVWLWLDRDRMQQQINQHARVINQIKIIIGKNDSGEIAKQVEATVVNSITESLKKEIWRSKN